MEATDRLVGLAPAGGRQPLSPFQAGGGAADRARLTRDDFYKIMISELSNQDPFEPLDNRQFLEQIASLQSLDATGRLSDGIEKLLLQSQMASASSLIGREVRAPAITIDENGTPTLGEVRGKVERVQVLGGQVRLVLEGSRPVRLEDVMEVS